MASLVMTEEQRNQLNDNGYVVLESFFQGAELDRMLQGVEALKARVEQSANASIDGVPTSSQVDPLCLELLDHPRILPYVVDAMGWNIHARDCLFSTQPPRAGAKSPDQLALAWHFDQEEEFTGLTQAVPSLTTKIES